MFGKKKKAEEAEAPEEAVEESRAGEAEDSAETEAAGEEEADESAPVVDEDGSVAGVKVKNSGELTEEQKALEAKFLEGIPRVNIGALFMPPIWGPGHGFWATILYYPIWLLADNVFYNTYEQQTVLTYVLSVVVFVSLLVGTVAFSVVCQPLAAHKAAEKGKTKEQYLRNERIWAVVCVIIGILMIIGATYYNLVIRPTVE